MGILSTTTVLIRFFSHTTIQQCLMRSVPIIMMNTLVVNKQTNKKKQKES
jgi:hypothetical protein